FLDCERFLMVRALKPLIDAGQIKLYAVDSLSRQGWINHQTSPANKIHLQERYDRFLTDELMPWIRYDCGGSRQPAAVTGASIGAFLAFTAAARHPARFDLMVGMSGTYRMDRRLLGYWDETWYFHDPNQFLPNLPDGQQLAQLRRSFFFLGLGRRHENPVYTESAARALASRSIPHHIERWGGDSGHDWPTWRTMLPMALRRLAR
ncbi:MAG: alpha/beta hydrolase-fold protein, partial [Myxococcota bacterium]